MDSPQDHTVSKGPARSPSTMGNPAAPGASGQMDDADTLPCLPRRRWWQNPWLRWRNAGAHAPNDLLKLFGLLVLANTTLFILCAAWFYSRTQAGFNARLEAFATLRDGPGSARNMEDLQKQTGELRGGLADALKKLSAAEARDAQYNWRLADLTAQITEIRSAPPPPSIGSASPVAASDASPTQSDLVLLKERNRLTAYADEAIATGARGPYERLWDAIEDPRLANLSHAARAEILRVQDCFLSGQRAKFYGIQQHQIPVAEIFPDSTALAPAQLSDDQFIEVLLNQKQSWQTRVKAAWHLGQRRNTKVGDALVKAIKNDPTLDVVAEATFSFEQVTGYHAKLFEVRPLEAWWKSYNEKPPPQKLAPKPPPGAKAEPNPE